MSKPYVRPMPRTWWLRTGAYRLFMLREISSVFIALFGLELVCLLARVAYAPDHTTRIARVQEFLAALHAPGWIFFHGVTLCFALLHTITWFNLTPKVMVVWIGEERLPGGLIAGANYALWLVVSAFIWWTVV